MCRNFESAQRDLDTLTALPKVGVAVLLTCSEYPDAVLVGRRVGSHGAGTLALPGGHLQSGEEWDACGKREVEEETGAPRFAHAGRA